ncbi:2,3-bisphosphoglycerate-independent phosphoglycerate mutase [bacterium]|nr:2,3-bisphosphoglycerate-independent phosphoglycerate mutase [bacterium]
MEYEKILPDIIKKNDNKILLVVLDGIGGFPHSVTGKTELETAKKPNLDRFATEGSCGTLTPVLKGITPGSGPGHVGLFGYDPLETLIGRGTLECLGIGINLGKNDVAIRGNFATIDENNIVTDRRAGRIPTEENSKIVSILSEKIKEISGVKIFIQTVKEHRCAIVLQGEGLGPNVSENDPQKEGLPLKPLKALDTASEKTALVLKELQEKVIEVLKNVDTKAKTLLLRGISQLPNIHSFNDKYKLNGVCIAAYPMYKGISKVLGMDVADAGETVEEEFETLFELYDKYDFFFFHIKKTDSYGEDGNFEAKVKTIEDIDSKIWQLRNLKFESIAITGDHSTPSMMKGHSWHPVPLIVKSPNSIPDGVKHFTERECAKGILGNMYSKELMYILLACAFKLDKFGA